MKGFNIFNQIENYWYCTETSFNNVKTVLERWSEGTRLSNSEIEAEIESRNNISGVHIDGSPSPEIAVIPIIGVLMNRVSLLSSISGGASYQVISNQIRSAANNDKVSSIILDVDSNGGAVSGIHVVTEAIKYAKSKKKVIAVVNDSALSGGYFIASQANEIVVSRSSRVGSISVIYTHYDRTKANEKDGIKVTVFKTGEWKALGHPDVSMSEKDSKKIQQELAKTHSDFVFSVASGRGLDVESVNSIATGEIFSGEEAIQMKLADRLGTIQDEINNQLNIGIKMNEQERNQLVSEISAQLTASLSENFESLNSKIQANTDALEESMAVIEKIKTDTVRAEAVSFVESQVGVKIMPEKRDALIESYIKDPELVRSLISSMPDGNFPKSGSVRSVRAQSDKIDVDTTSAEDKVFAQLGISVGSDGTLAVPKA